MNKCGKCDAPLKWIKTPKGKAMPCNTALKTIVTADGKVVQGYESHFATCAYAEHFRKKS